MAVYDRARAWLGGTVVWDIDDDPDDASRRLEAIASMNPPGRGRRVASRRALALTAAYLDAVGWDIPDKLGNTAAAERDPLLLQGWGAGRGGPEMAALRHHLSCAGIQTDTLEDARNLVRRARRLRGEGRI